MVVSGAGASKSLEIEKMRLGPEPVINNSETYCRGGIVCTKYEAKQTKKIAVHKTETTTKT